jgi:transcription elongation factor GreA
MKKNISLTKDGKAELEKELKELIAERPLVADRLAYARSFGDLKENQEYTDARDEQRQIETRILEIEDILKNAKIIETGSFKEVAVGAKVRIKILGKEHEYMIVGEVEADPLNGRISDISPIGKAIMGKKVGDKYLLPNGNEGEILSIE